MQVKFTTVVTLGTFGNFFLVIFHIEDLAQNADNDPKNALVITSMNLPFSYDYLQLLSSLKLRLE